MSLACYGRPDKCPKFFFGSFLHSSRFWYWYLAVYLQLPFDLIDATMKGFWGCCCSAPAMAVPRAFNGSTSTRTTESSSTSSDGSASSTASTPSSRGSPGSTSRCWIQVNDWRWGGLIQLVMDQPMGYLNSCGAMFRIVSGSATILKLGGYW